MASKERNRAEKKNSRKTEESTNENKADTPVTVNDESIHEEVTVTTKVETPTEATAELVYDEPALAELIVESYEGEKIRGLYEGEGEAYFLGGHFYKGFFSEGYMHGKGHYIWADGVQYEGDFMKNQITGKGMYTWSDGSMYVGDVLNGLRHGFGTFHSPNPNVSYTGDWSEGKRHGKGRMDYDPEGKSYYEGDWANGIKHGWGVRLYSSGNFYHGMWFNNVRHGEGTMKWLDKDQVYAGQWENGIQHGMGQHIWLFRRVHLSQYPLRNMYDGELVNGQRHGQGVFYYANGAKYAGFWKNNMKHGKGTFTFKNGRTYEGMFEKDHIVDYPDFSMDETSSPDLSQIRTRTPVNTDKMSVHSNESKNTTSPSFLLEVDNLLATLAPEEREHEMSQVMYSVTRYISTLRHIYIFYSTLGYDESPDNTFVMNKMQFWRFLKDIHLHHGKYKLTDMDREIGANYQKPNFELHNPYEKVLQRQFVNYLIILAHLVYKKDHKDQKITMPILEYCFSRFMREKVLCLASIVKSPIYADVQRAKNALVHMDQAYEIYQAVSTHRKHPPREPVLKMRQFLFLLKDLSLINQDLTINAVLKILRCDYPDVSDGEGCYNLELEMTFLDYFESLVRCAEKFVTESMVKEQTSPRPSTGLTQEQSTHSVPGLLSRMTSQGAAEEETAQGLSSPASQQTRKFSTVIDSKKMSGEEVAVKVENVSAATPSELQSRKQSIGQDTSNMEQNQETAVSATEIFEESHSQSHVSLTKMHKQSTSYVETKISLEQPASQIKALPEYSAEEGIEEEIVQEEQVLEEEIDLVDEAARKFNFWTNQVHLFFMCVFFPAADKYINMKTLMEMKLLEGARQKLTVPEN